MYYENTYLHMVKGSSMTRFLTHQTMQTKKHDCTAKAPNILANNDSLGMVGWVPTIKHKVHKVLSIPLLKGEHYRMPIHEEEWVTPQAEKLLPASPFSSRVVEIQD